MLCVIVAGTITIIGKFSSHTEDWKTPPDLLRITNISFVASAVRKTLTTIRKVEVHLKKTPRLASHHLSASSR